MSSGSRPVPARGLRIPAPLLGLYTANAALLLTHEIDSAFREEWELFGLPGGIGVFLLLHVPLAALVLHGMRRLAEGNRAGLRYSWFLAAAGLAAAGVHGGFLLAGDSRFASPSSVAILGAVLAASSLQAYWTRAAARRLALR